MADLNAVGRAGADVDGALRPWRADLLDDWLRTKNHDGGIAVGDEFTGRVK